MNTKNWRIKQAINRGSVHSSTKPGDCVSVDQLESTTPGFVAQLKGKSQKIGTDV